MNILKWFFQNKETYPLQPNRDQVMGQQSESVEAALKRLTETFTMEQTERPRNYLEQTEQFMDMERQLAYENGFLLASELWLEIWKRLGGPGV